VPQLRSVLLINLPDNYFVDTMAPPKPCRSYKRTGNTLPQATPDARTTDESRPLPNLGPYSSDEPSVPLAFQSLHLWKLPESSSVGCRQPVA
jgi:hypothetical protein